MREISCINVVGLQTYSVGSDISKIVNISREWADGIDFIYEVYDENGNLMAEIINCPVVVSFFPQENKAKLFDEDLPY